MRREANYTDFVEGENTKPLPQMVAVRITSFSKRVTRSDTFRKG